MAAKSKSGKVRGVARRIAAKPPARQARLVTPGAAWEQIGQVPDERDDEFDCERIVQGEDGRSLPLYYDDFN